MAGVSQFSRSSFQLLLSAVFESCVFRLSLFEIPRRGSCWFVTWLGLKFGLRAAHCAFRALSSHRRTFKAPHFAHLACSPDATGSVRKPFDENACDENESRERSHPVHVPELVKRPQRHALKYRERFRASCLERICSACFGAFICKRAHGRNQRWLRNLTLRNFRFFNPTPKSRQVKFRAIYNSRDMQTRTFAAYTCCCIYCAYYLLATS